MNSRAQARGRFVHRESRGKAGEMNAEGAEREGKERGEEEEGERDEREKMKEKRKGKNAERRKGRKQQADYFVGAGDGVGCP